MEPSFWHQRWENNKIGFHLGQVNPYLVQYWPDLDLHTGSRIFVPLCGKSMDMLWLAEQGHEVIGVEISPIAVQAFFEDNQLKPEVTQQGAFEIWSVDQITILLGDYFELHPAQLGEVEAVYDRASLVALPEEMRADYVEHLNALCPSVPRLLITLDYEQSCMSGPPFAVSNEEVQELYQDRTSLVLLGASDILNENERFRQQGLERLVEAVWQIGA